MPQYDLRCECGWEEDDVILRHDQRELARCPECGGGLRHKIPSVNVSGQVPVKAYGMTFANDKAADRHAQEYAPGAQTLDGAAADRYYQKVRENADARCREWGYVDMDDRVRHVKEINAAKRRQARGERKPFVMPAAKA